MFILLRRLSCQLVSLFVVVLFFSSTALATKKNKALPAQGEDGSCDFSRLQQSLETVYFFLMEEIVSPEDLRDLIITEAQKNGLPVDDFVNRPLYQIATRKHRYTSEEKRRIYNDMPYTYLIHVTCAGSTYGKFQVLVSLGSKINSLDKPLGNTALLQAIDEGRVDAVTWLIAADADLHVGSSARELSHHALYRAFAKYRQTPTSHIKSMLHVVMSSPQLFGGKAAVGDISAGFITSTAGKEELFYDVLFWAYQIHYLDALLRNQDDLADDPRETPNTLPHGNPLHFAAFCGQDKVVRRLLAWKPQLNKQPTETLKFLPYHFAIAGAIEFDSKRPLLLASYRATIQALIHAGGNVDLNFPLDGGIFSGWTPLYLAVSTKHLALMELLLSEGANADAPMLSGTGELSLVTPRRLAMRADVADQFEHLLEKATIARATPTSLELHASPALLPSAAEAAPLIQGLREEEEAGEEESEKSDERLLEPLVESKAPGPLGAPAANAAPSWSKKASRKAHHITSLEEGQRAALAASQEYAYYAIAEEASRSHLEADQRQDFKQVERKRHDDNRQIQQEVDLQRKTRRLQRSLKQACNETPAHEQQARHELEYAEAQRRSAIADSFLASEKDILTAEEARRSDFLLMQTRPLEAEEGNQRGLAAADEAYQRLRLQGLRCQDAEQIRRKRIALSQVQEFLPIFMSGSLPPSFLRHCELLKQGVPFDTKLPKEVRPEPRAFLPGPGSRGANQSYSYPRFEQDRSVAASHGQGYPYPLMYGPGYPYPLMYGQVYPYPLMYGQVYPCPLMYGQGYQGYPSNR